MITHCTCPAKLQEIDLIMQVMRGRFQKWVRLSFFQFFSTNLVSFFHFFHFFSTMFHESHCDRRDIRVLVASDSFKDTLEAQQIGESVHEALVSGSTDSSIHFVTENCPLSDGGEGFLKAYKPHLEREEVIQVTGPFGTQGHHIEVVDAPIGFLQDGTAVIEMARICGLELVSLETRNPFYTTTRGVGEILRLAWKKFGTTKFLLGVGGSATNDAGIGCLQGLGYQIVLSNPDVRLDHQSKESFTGAMLSRVVRIEDPEDEEVRKLIGSSMNVTIACDVNNPFSGPKGAVHVYSEQKGAKTVEMREFLEEGMKHVELIFHSLTGASGLPQGSGAAGGIAGGLYAIIGAKLQPGIDLLGESLHLRDQIEKASIVFTGEGKFDAQTMHGKVVSHVARLVQESNSHDADGHKRVLVIVCGQKEIEDRDWDWDWDWGHTGKPVVLELASRFPLDICMAETSNCVREVVIEALPGILESIPMD
jgi:glycerate 2-kinase